MTRPVSINIAVLMLTPRCDMACEFCGADAAFEELGLSRAQDALDRLAAQGFQNLILGGGEPTCWRENLWAFAGLAREKGFLLQVGSNAASLPEGFAARPEVDRWVLPLESADPQANDRMRPLKEGSHYTRVMAALRACADAGKEVTLSTVVSRENVEDLGGLAALLERFQEHGGRLHAWHLYRFQPEGRGGLAHAPRFALPLEDFLEAGRKVRAAASALTLYLRPDLYQSRQVAFFYQHGGKILRRDRDGIRAL